MSYDMIITDRYEKHLVANMLPSGVDYDCSINVGVATVNSWTYQTFLSYNYGVCLGYTNFSK